MLISIVIPIYNSEHAILNTIRHIKNVMTKNAHDYEIILGDDASTDQSKKIMMEAAIVDSSVKCIYQDENKGLGAILKRLFEQAQGKIIIYSDCDLPFGEEVFSHLIKHLNEADVVIASRYLKHPNHVSFTRKLFSRLYFLIAWILFNIPVKDIGSGAVAFRREVLDEIDLSLNGFGFHIEFLLQAQKNGFHIRELSHESYYRKNGSFKIFHHGWQVIKETMQLCLRK